MRGPSSVIVILQRLTTHFLSQLCRQTDIFSTPLRKLTKFRLRTERQTPEDRLSVAKQQKMTLIELKIKLLDIIV